MHSKNTLLTALTGFALVAGSANAATIFSEDFENSDTADGTPLFVGQWPSTDFTGAANGNELNTANYFGTAPTVPAAAGLGGAFGIVNRGQTFRTTLTGESFANNTVYTLTFDHFKRNDVDGDAVEARIMTASGLILAETEFAAVTTDGLVVSRQVQWTTDGGVELGQDIRIEFQDPNAGGSSPQAALDNIVLTAVPEPGSLALMGLGGLCILRRRRG